MTPNLDIDCLRTFAAIADSGGFTQAAKHVHRTQSAVSMQVRKLEEAIGRPLFLRDGRGVTLTADGEALLAYARRLLGLHDEAVASLTRPDMVGVVRIGTPDDYVARFLPEVLARFARTHPRVQVEVLCESSMTLRELLPQGAIDLALITCAPGAESGEVVRHEPTVWATSERHLAHEAEPLPLALFQKGCWFRDWAIASLTRTGRAYRIAYTSPSIAGVLAAVSAGLAVTVLGRAMLPSGVRALSAEEGFPPLPSAAITLHRSAERRSPAIDALAEHIAAAFDGEGFVQGVTPLRVVAGA